MQRSRAGRLFCARNGNEDQTAGRPSVRYRLAEHLVLHQGLLDVAAHADRKLDVRNHDLLMCGLERALALAVGQDCVQGAQGRGLLADLDEVCIHDHQDLQQGPDLRPRTHLALCAARSLVSRSSSPADGPNSKRRHSMHKEGTRRLTNSENRGRLGPPRWATQNQFESLHARQQVRNHETHVSRSANSRRKALQPLLVRASRSVGHAGIGCVDGEALPCDARIVSAMIASYRAPQLPFAPLNRSFLLHVDNE